MNKFVHPLNAAKKSLSPAPKFDDWCFVVADTVRKAVQTLVQFYQKKHQYIPISRVAQKELHEEEWKPYRDGYYQGPWQNNQRHGHGSFRYNNGDHYDGRWQNDERHGLGVLTKLNRDVYDGDWQHDLKDGFGIEITSHEKYEGEWSQGEREGYGKSTNLGQTGDGQWKTYEGDWKRGIRSDWGAVKDNNGHVLKADYQGINGQEKGPKIQQGTFHEIVQITLDEFLRAQKDLVQIGTGGPTGLHVAAQNRLLAALKESHKCIDRERERVGRSDPRFYQTDGCPFRTLN